MTILSSLVSMVQPSMKILLPEGSIQKRKETIERNFADSQKNAARPLI